MIETYTNSLTEAQNRGRSEVLAKNNAQAALVQQLDVIATNLNLLAQGDAQMIVNAGFTLQQSTGVRYTDKLPAPVVVRAVSTGKRGEVRIVLDDQVPATVVATHAVEYSLDRESGWQNGTYHSHRSFVADGLPRAEALWLRLKSIGHGNKRSDWSEPVVVAVL